jgi:signal transduction histidine kinase
LVYLYQRNKRKQIKKEFELLSQLSNVEYKNKISSEKLRISRELHDNIGSHLTFIISSLDNITYKKNFGDTGKLKDLSSFGRKALNELRETIWMIKGDDKNLSQLITKLYELKNNIISDFDIKIINEVSSEISLSSIDSINIFRVVQEAIQNSIKHSKSDKIKIQFSDFGRGFKLEIIDYGVGFDISNTEYGNGINNMKYRCKEANGDFFIKSNSFGTVITCSFSF